jgi:hypothetical protein
VAILTNSAEGRGPVDGPLRVSPPSGTINRVAYSGVEFPVEVTITFPGQDPVDMLIVGPNEITLAFD